MPPRFIVKICGITSLDDGLAALDAGADWLGFVRWPPSKRYVDRDPAAEIVGALRDQAPRPFHSVGVYVDADRETIDADVAAVGFDRAQLHGEETLIFARSLPYPVIKSVKAENPDRLAELAAMYEGLDLLVDTWDPDLPGGTGKGHADDALAVLAALMRDRRVLLAGGLHPGNVGDMVERLGPWGVDVSSGVESAPGRKDPALVRAFIRAARRAAESAGR
jgi:phosphoribosylanthranilate isomerase